MPALLGLAAYRPAVGSPYTARYPQNRGLADLANRLAAGNAAAAARPVMPYQPSLGGLGAAPYAAGLASGGGLMNNYQAQNNSHRLHAATDSRRELRTGWLQPTEPSD